MTTPDMALPEPDPLDLDPPSQTPPRSDADKLLHATRTQIAEMTKETIQVLVHELQVYQVELEMQNEELRRAQLELAESRDRYSDLYDFAPLAYLTLGEDSRILEANLTAGTMLGMARSELKGVAMTHFINPMDQDIFYQSRKRTIADDLSQRSELQMHRADSQPFTARLETVAIHDHEGQLNGLRIIISDITEINRAERIIEKFNFSLQDSDRKSRDLLCAETEVIGRDRLQKEPINDELKEANTKLQARLDGLLGTKHDIEKLIDNSVPATLFLDTSLRIRRFTKQAAQLMKLIPTDLGLPVTDLDSEFIYPGLTESVAEVLSSLAAAEKLITTTDGRWFHTRIMPYRALYNKIDGVVITFSDVTKAKRLEAEPSQ